LRIRFTRGPGANGVVRLTLATSQPPTLVNGNPNALLMLRGTAVTVDVPVDAAARAAADRAAQAEKAVAELKKKLPKEGEADAQLAAQLTAAAGKRDEATQQLRDAEVKIPPTYEYAVVVPAELKPGSYDLAIRAELRGVDNLAAVREAVTAPRRLQILPPLELTVAAGADTAVPFDAKTGATVAVTGAIKRLAGFAGNVTLTLAGLPAGIVVPRVVLKPTEEKYELSIKLPPAFVADRIEPLQVVASLGPDARRPATLTQVERPLPAIRIERSPPPAPAAKAPSAPVQAPTTDPAPAK
jgi:hypothetical protein